MPIDGVEISSQLMHQTLVRLLPRFITLINQTSCLQGINCELRKKIMEVNNYTVLIIMGTQTSIYKTSVKNITVRYTPIHSECASPGSFFFFKISISNFDFFARYSGLQ